MLRVLLLTAFVSALPEPQYKFSETVGGSGDITYYHGDGSGGTCSFDAVEDLMFAAMPKPVWENSKYCGACIRVTGPKGQVVVKVVDQCPECKAGDLDLSPQAFELIEDKDVGRKLVSWEWVDCRADKTGGKLEYFWKEGSSNYWFGLQIRENIKPVLSVSLNGQELRREFYNYFIYSNGGPFQDGPYTVTVKFTDGTSVTDTGLELNKRMIGQSIQPGTAGRSSAPATEEGVVSVKEVVENQEETDPILVDEAETDSISEKEENLVLVEPVPYVAPPKKCKTTHHQI